MSKAVKAVKAQAAEAERLHKEIYGGQQEAAQETPPAAEPPAETPPAAAQATPPAAPEQQVVQHPAKKDDFEHKYNTLRGMFNKEVPRLNALVTELKDRCLNYETIIEDLKRQVTAKPAASDQEGQRFIRDEEVDEYGQDMIDVMKRAAREAVSEELTLLKQQNAELRTQNLQLQQSLGTVNATTARTAREHVFDTLSARVPDWQTINEEPAFIEWLSQVDAFSGRPFQEMLTEAFERHDAPRVTAFFERYVNEKSLSSRRTNDPRGAAQPAPTVRMDTLVAPGKPQRSQSAQPVSEFEGEIWTQEQINAFYSDCAKGKFKNNPEERLKIERRIHRAVNEGRVR